MEFTARIKKEGKFWLIQIKELDMMTQGMTRKEAIIMIKDLFQEMLYDQFELKLEISLLSEEKESATLFVPDQYAIPFVLKRLRALKGKTIQEISKLCGFKSINAYAQYEQGKRIPGIEQLEKFLEIMGAHLKMAVSVHS